MGELQKHSYLHVMGMGLQHSCTFNFNQQMVKKTSNDRDTVPISLSSILMPCTLRLLVQRFPVRRDFVVELSLSLFALHSLSMLWCVSTAKRRRFQGRAVSQSACRHELRCARIWRDGHLVCRREAVAKKVEFELQCAETFCLRRCG